MGKDSHEEQALWRFARIHLGVGRSDRFGHPLNRSYVRLMSDDDILRAAVGLTPADVAKVRYFGGNSLARLQELAASRHVGLSRGAEGLDSRSGSVTVGRMEPKLLRMPQVAQLLSLSRSQVYALASRGEIPTIRLGSSLRVPADALNEWIARNTQMPVR